MANRDFRKIERIMKDFSLNLGSGEGGTIKVDELPETGEKHTIYELSEKKQEGSTYNWVLENDNKYLINASLTAKVVETSEDLPTLMDDEPYYVRSEDKFGFADEREGRFVWIEHFENKVGVFGDYTYLNIIYKDITWDDSNERFVYTLLDDSTFVVPMAEEPIEIWASKLVEVQQVEVVMSVIGTPTILINNESELPTYEQLVEQDLINVNGYCIYAYVTLQGDAWHGITGKDEVTWDYFELEIKHEIAFDDSDRPQTYLFVRQNGGEVIETSYWVYNNNAWEKLDSGASTCSIFVEFTYGTLEENKKFSAPKLSDIVINCNYTITDLENYDFVVGEESNYYVTKSTGIISGLPITSLKDNDFTEIIFDTQVFDVFVGEVYVRRCLFNSDAAERDENGHWHIKNFVGGYLSIDGDYRALN